MAISKKMLELLSDIDVPLKRDSGISGDIILPLNPGDRFEPIGNDEQGFGANLANSLDEIAETSLSTELYDAIKEDEDSEKEWRDTLARGIDLLGAHFEERDFPFKGACGATHPLMAEAAVQFQAQAIKQIFPSGGPVHTKIVGKKTMEKEEQAARVKDFLNYLVTDVMQEYEPQLDQMLFMLPIQGSTFRKVWFNRALKRPMVSLIDAEDFITNYHTEDLMSSPRYTHVIRKTKGQLQRDIENGLYVDFLYDMGGEDQFVSDYHQKRDEIQGRESTHPDERYTLWESHADLILADYGISDEYANVGYPLPYIVTLDKYSGKIVGLRRNWREDDPLKKKRMWFSHYRFLPGFGFKGFSLIHMIGGLSKASTAALRQLVDAGTLQNLPGGFKRRGTRIPGGEEPVQPGEWRDIDYYGEHIKDAFFPLPYKEPSVVLFQLLGFMVQAGQRYTTITDPMVGEGDTKGPVGTTVALIEQGQKVFSSIHKRLHYGQKGELNIISEIVADHLGPEYPFEVEGGDRMILKSDFDGRIDIIPVSDPNVSSTAQRIAQAQTTYQIAQTSPNLHDMRAVIHRMYSALAIPDIDEVLPKPEDPPPMDPVTENMAVLHNKPIKSYEWEDHAAHLKVHETFMQDPMFGAKQGAAEIIAPAMIAHIGEHMAFLYKQKMQQMMGAQIPQTPDFNAVEKEPQEPISPLQSNFVAADAARVAPQVLQQDMQQAAQSDPELDKELVELEIKRTELEKKKLELQQQGIENEIEKIRLASEAQQHQADTVLKKGEIEAEQRIKSAERDSDERIAAAQNATTIAKTRIDTDSRERVAQINAAAKLRDSHIKAEAQKESDEAKAEMQEKSDEAKADMQKSSDKSKERIAKSKPSTTSKEKKK